MSTTRIAFTLLAALALGCPASHAEEEAKMAGFKLKNRAAFTSPENARAPFWPIGWQKPVAGAVTQQEVETPKVKLDPDQFSVTSILVGRPSLAVINGRAYSEGEFIRAPKAKDKGAAAGIGAAAIPAGVKVRVARVSDGGVTLELNGALTELTIRRPQLNTKSEDEGADLLKPLSER
jgi:hypothetical protein